MSTNQKLLIVEDDESARSVIRDALDVIANLDFLEASNGIEALRVVNDSEPDVILLDLLMPELDGFEVLKRLRLDSRRGRIKVLVISALSEPALIELLSELGADGVVPKPFHVDELTSMVQQAVDDVRATAPPGGNARSASARGCTPGESPRPGHRPRDVECRIPVETRPTRVDERVT